MAPETAGAVAQPKKDFQLLFIWFFWVLYILSAIVNMGIY
jgi:hypothetical protein